MPSIEDGRLRGKQERLQAHKTGENTYKVYNVAKGTSYEVTKSNSGVWYCNCPWQTKGSRLGGYCKHVVRVLDKENGCITCGRNDKYADLKRLEDTGPFVCKVCRIENG